MSNRTSIAKKTSIWLVAAWCLIGMTLTLFLTIEAILHTVRKATSWGEDPRVHADAFPDARFAREYLAELDSWTYQSHPFVDWISAPRKGKYINVGADGIRATWHDGFTRDHSGCRPIKIFLFGGSTMAGMGASDNETIASYLVRFLDKDRKSCVQVINFGCPGYVSTQNVVRLMDEIAAGNTPDLAIFYGGINEVVAAYRDAASPQSDGRIGHEVELLRGSDRDLFRHTFLALLNHSILVEWTRTLAEKASGWFRPKRMPGTAENANSDTHQIDTALDRYVAEKRCVEALGDRFGFHSLFFWQPIIYSKNRLSPYEADVVAHEPPGVTKFFALAYARAHERLADEGVIDISEILNNTNKPYFIDEWHITGPGNEIVARRMVIDVEKALQALMDSERGGMKPGPK